MPNKQLKPSGVHDIVLCVCVKGLSSKTGLMGLKSNQYSLEELNFAWYWVGVEETLFDGTTNLGVRKDFGK